MISLSRSTAPALVFSLLVAACGASAAGGGAGGAGGAGGGTASNACEALVTDAPAAPVPVRLVNQTSGDLYVAISGYASCYQNLLFSASVADTTVDANRPPAQDCGGWTCATEKCSTCTVTWTCSTYSPVTRIAPGGTVTSSWDGLVYQKRSVPSACVADVGCFGGEANVTCPVALANTSWPVTFTATMSTGVSCESGTCTCTPDATGTCVMPLGDAATPSSTTVQGTATLAEGGTSVDIVFQ
jgi:hypothetical protein